MNRKPDKLEALLMEKSFKDLLPEEQSWVNQHYSAEEYDAMRHTMQKSTALFEKEQTAPNPKIKSRLQHRLRQNREPAKVRPLLLYRIPAWQAVAAVALLLFFIPQIQKQQAKDQEQVVVYHIDTVFKEIPVKTIISPIIDTVTNIPKVNKIIKQQQLSSIKNKTVVFNQQTAPATDLSNDISGYLASTYDSVSIENIISRYLKDSVESYRVDIDTGFQDLGRIY